MPSPLPDWYQPHGYQADAVGEVITAFDRVPVVFLDAPTGTGKSWIGELVRREMGVRNSIYMCTSLDLQDQVLKDFEYARVLKGRGNYESQTPGVTTDACTYGGPDSPCWFCDDRVLCSYQVAKREALDTELAVLNTSYFLNETRGEHSSFTQYPFVIADECDVLERTLRGFIEVRVGSGMLRWLKLDAPAKGMRYERVAEWMSGTLAPRLREKATTLGNEPEQIARRARIRQLAQQVQGASVTFGDGWVRDDGGDGFGIKPVKVDGFGWEKLWKKADRWLCMSATIVDPQQTAKDLGLADEDWELVTVPAQFDPANHPIRIVPIVNMKSGDGWEERAQQMADACAGVVRNHPGERVLIHTVSYKLAEVINQRLVEEFDGQRMIVSYRNAGGRALAIEMYRSKEASVLVAPSLDRGVDFRDDDCRVQVVAKVPFPNLGDKMVGARMHLPDGQRWYSTETVRTIVQMTGRGVRHKDDWAVTYVLDSAMIKVLRTSGHLFPEAWKASMDMNYDKRKVLADG